MKTILATLALLILAALPARAQNVVIVASCGAQSLSLSPPLGVVFYMDQTGNLCTPAGGGGGGGAVTVANGADVTQGAIADAAAAAGGTGTVSAKLREATALLQSILTGPLAVTGTFFQTTQPVSGTVTANPTIKTVTWIAPTSASITTSGTVVAAGPAVSVITNATATGGGPLTLNLFGGTAVANVGIPLASGASMTVSGQPAGTAITGICSTGTCSAAIQSGS